MEMPTCNKKNLLKERNICVIDRIDYLLFKATVAILLLDIVCRYNSFVF